jgi:hypothetical protein
MSMSRPTTAVLISLLIFPGFGHLYLRRKARALLFIVPALAAGLYFANDAWTRANALADQIMSGSLGTDPVALAARLDNSGATSPLVDLAMYVVLACWIGAALDAWLLARRLPPKA